MDSKKAKTPFALHVITRSYNLSAVGFVASRSLTSSLTGSLRLSTTPTNKKKSELLAAKLRQVGKGAFPFCRDLILRPYFVSQAFEIYEV